MSLPGRHLLVRRPVCCRGPEAVGENLCSNKTLCRSHHRHDQLDPFVKHHLWIIERSHIEVFTPRGPCRISLNTFINIAGGVEDTHGVCMTTWRSGRVNRPAR